MVCGQVLIASQLDTDPTPKSHSTSASKDHFWHQLVELESPRKWILPWRFACKKLVASAFGNNNCQEIMETELGTGTSWTIMHFQQGVLKWGWSFGGIANRSNYSPSWVVIGCVLPCCRGSITFNSPHHQRAKLREFISSETSVIPPRS